MIMAARPFDVYTGVYIVKNRLISISDDCINDNNGHYKIHRTVTEIATYAFVGQTTLTSVIIPFSIRNINNYAFYSCINLKSVILHNAEITIGEGVFNFCHKDLKITIIATDSSEESVEKLKKQLQQEYPHINIHVELPCREYYIKGISTFYSQQSELEDNNNTSSLSSSPN